MIPQPGGRRLRTAFPGLFAALALILTACGAETDQESRVQVTAPDRAPRQDATIQTVESFTLEAAITDLALLPAAEPWRGRAIASLAGGGAGLVDLSLGGVVTVETPPIRALATVETFELRGAPAPLVLALQDADAPLGVYLLGPDLDVLLPAPVTAAPVDFSPEALCVLSIRPGAVDIALAAEGRAAAFRLRDIGEDALVLEAGAEASLTERARVCVEQAVGAAVTVQDGALTVDGGVMGSLAKALGRADASAIAAVETNSEIARLAALPDEERVALAVGIAAPRVVMFAIADGLNAAGAKSPQAIAASPRNFGGSYGDGVLLVADGAVVSVVSLADALDLARRTLDSAT